MSANLTAEHLRCEYLENPLAVNTEQPRLSWEVQSSQRDCRQQAYRILVADSRDALQHDEGNLWDSGRVESDQTLHIGYDGGRLDSTQWAYWKVKIWDQEGNASPWSESAYWRMGILKPEDWQAKWIMQQRSGPEEEPRPALPSPMLRKEFALNKPIKRAVINATALGLYELHINGRRLGDRLLTPEWTDYHKRVQYQAYDVTDLLKEGGNAIGAVLGEGWYAGRIGISVVLGDNDPIRGFYGDRLQLLTQLEVEYADGSKDIIVSDGSWKGTDDGPIHKACILDGEVYDARKEIPGWTQCGFDDSNWQSVQVTDTIDAELVAQPNEPIRKTEKLKPVKIAEPSPSIYVVDFGQEIAGACRLKAKGSAGTEIRLRYAEMLKDDGNIYRDNLRMPVYKNHLGARQEDRFILAGKGEESFFPHFTYHGFRYVEVSGYPGTLGKEDIEAWAFHSTPERTGSFECSAPILNKLMTNVTWTLRDNLHSIPTDCPQRDERMGWSGDMLVFAQPACFLMDMAAFFTKWTQDLRDDQADDGRFPDFAPHPYDPNKRCSGVAAWGDVGVVVPWRMYVNYGDTRALKANFTAARKWVDFICRHNSDLLWKNNRGNDYGDWLNGDTLKLEGFPKGEAEVPKDVFATAFFQHSTELVARMAEVIGEKEAADEYGRLAEDIRQAFIKAYVSEDGKVQGHTQAGYALALNFNLVPDNLRKRAARHMAQRIHDYKDHISTGFHTTIMLMNQLTRMGYNDLAYMLINNRTIPSWGYTIEQGATTIWERWDGYVEGRGFQDPGMNSFCHYAIGSVSEWMYRTILGINPDPKQPAYKHFTIHPQPGGGLTWAEGAYDSIRGKINSAWRIDEEGYHLEVTIPANTTATVWIPTAEPTMVTESGRPASEAEGVKSVNSSKDWVIYEVGSGAYRFLAAK